MPDLSAAALSAPDGQGSVQDPNEGTPALSSSAPAAGDTPPTEYWGKGILKEDGSFDHSKWDKAPEDIRDVAKDFSKFKNWDEAAKAWKGKNELLGKKGIADPLPKDATPEQRAAHMDLVRKALGAPDKAEGYVIERPKELPENMWDSKAVSEAAKIAYEEGVSPVALQKLVAYETARQIEAGKAQEAALEGHFQAQDSLIRANLAKEGLDYAKGREWVDKACQKWGLAKDSIILKDASAFLFAMRVGKAGGEAPLIQGDTKDDDLRPHTAETALKALSNIRDNSKNPEWFAYWNRDPENPKKDKVHPDHDAVVAKAKKLSAIAYADRKR